MKGDIAFAGFMLTAEEWRALDSETRAQLVAVARRFPAGTEPPYHPAKTYIAGGTIVPDAPERPLAEGSGPLATDDYIELFGDED